MNSYFKYFNEINKLKSFNGDENKVLNYINYDDLLLDYIYEKEDLNLANVIFPLVEDKTLLRRFIQFLNFCKVEEEKEWIKVIFENRFNQSNQIDIFAFDNTLLKYSAKNGLIEIVKYLVENGADIHTEDDFSIILASENGHLEVVKYLVENGANIHIHNNEILRKESKYGHLEIVKCLVENGANVNACNDEALRWASYYGYFEIVKYLVKKGANIHSNNNEALRHAKNNNHVNIVNFFKTII